MFAFVFVYVFMFVFMFLFVFMFVHVLYSYLVNDLLSHCDDVGVLLPQHDEPLQPINFAWQPGQENAISNLVQILFIFYRHQYQQALSE